MKIVNVEEMRRLEQATDAGGQSYAAMMEMAGHAVATAAIVLQLAAPGRSVLILVGPGNNGGDGLVAARFLCEQHYEVAVYIWARERKGDRNLRRLKQRRRGVNILYAENDPDFAKLREEVRRAGLIVDALLGTGMTRPIQGRLAELLAIVREEVTVLRSAARADSETLPPEVPRFPILEAYSLAMPGPPPHPPGPTWHDEWDDGDDLDAIAADEDTWDEDEDADVLPRPPWRPAPVLAVDCPSGLNCDTGALDQAALDADLTVTFGYPKWGQVQFPGAAACGLLAVADIGSPPELGAEIPVTLAEPREIKRLLPPRPADAHKGLFGKVMIAGGSLSYTGAAYLSAAAAARSGAGLVTLAVPAPLHSALSGALPEVTWLLLPAPTGTHSAAGALRLLDSLASYDALVVGPGLTASEDARGFVETLFAAEGLARDHWQGRLVVDADALNLLVDLPGWPERLPPNSVLTPHPGEMARLTGTTIGEVNGCRIENARRWAATWGHIVLLKGPHTVIAAPDGRATVLPFAAPTLATAGSGDVLAGAIVALIGQGLPPYEAAIAGAYLHGHAGALLATDAGVSGPLARDIAQRLPEAFRRIAQSC